MATYTSLQISDGFPVTQPDAGVVAFVRGRVTLTSVAALNDVLEFFKLPKGAIVCGMRFVGDELDTNGSPTMDVEFGHATDQNAYGTLTNLDMSVNGTEGNWLLNLIQDADAVPTTQQETITAVITGAPATAAAGDVYLDCFYTMAITNT